jgi:hypothetical protein
MDCVPRYVHVHVSTFTQSYYFLGAKVAPRLVLSDESPIIVIADMHVSNDMQLLEGGVVHQW